MAYVKVSAKFLAHVGSIEAEKHLYAVLSELGEIRESANVSRIDLFVDFQSSVDMESWDRQAWVTRAASINTYAVSGQFSGWSVGLGGVISSRLYNKLLEIVVSGKEWIVPLWQKTGWDGNGLIWRLEFEIKREVLTQKGLFKLHQVLNHLNGLWSYATTEWLRLTIPSDDDKTRSRWPIHPLWLLLSSVDLESKGGPLAKRFSPARSPNDDKLFQIAYSSILSYMAKHGFPANELYEGTEDFLANAYAYHEKKAYDQGLPFDDFIAERLALKHRQYNTAINDPEQDAKRKAKELEDQARAYRKARGADMETLTLQQAAALLKIHPVTLQEKARVGDIPGAKIGKCWVFLEIDLIEYIRSQYRRRVLQGAHERNITCHSSNAKIRPVGGSKLSSTDERYNAALGLKTKSKLRNSTTG